MILRRQVRRQETDRSQRDRPVGEQLQDDWKAARSASGLDPAISGMFREAKDLRAVREERRTALREIEPPRVKLHERRNQMSRRLPLEFGQPPDLDEQLVV
jgi:hypothetical protein